MAVAGDAVIHEGQQVLANTYARYPIVLVRGKGATVWDSTGKEYLDCVAGLAVCNLGHCHPKVVATIEQQARELIHCSNFYYIAPQVELAKRLCAHSFGDRVFFCNSGAEATEAAIKLARKYATERFGKERYEIIAMANSFHGRTMGALSATGQDRFHEGFHPLLPGFHHVPFDDIEAVANAIDQKTCAVLVEPIQGEGGVKVPAMDYLKKLRALCDQTETLLIYDEVQVGMGRTGTLFAYEQYGASPDIMTLAKSLANGIPIGALVATDAAAQAFTPGAHASTFGGNPLATAVGCCVVDTLLEDGILEHCKEMGAYLYEGLLHLKDRYPFIIAVRGKGLISACELAFTGKKIVERCMEQGVLINCTAETVLRFLPPLIVTQGEIDRLLATLDGIFAEQ
jgi:predicted acetylornithine/succinylornithine family transaminase